MIGLLLFVVVVVEEEVKEEKIEGNFGVVIEAKGNSIVCILYIVLYTDG